jgi:hypothetical protein
MNRGLTEGAVTAAMSSIDARRSDEVAAMRIDDVVAMSSRDEQ